MRVLQIAFKPSCERVRSTEHAPRDRFYLLERRHGLADIVERGAFVIVERRRVALQYLNLHLTHRGASWASGAAQAAQFVRIILLWRGLVAAAACVSVINPFCCFCNSRRDLELFECRSVR